MGFLYLHNTSNIRTVLKLRYFSTIRNLLFVFTYLNYQVKKATGLSGKIQNPQYQFSSEVENQWENWKIEINCKIVMSRIVLIIIPFFFFSCTEIYFTEVQPNGGVLQTEIPDETCGYYRMIDLEDNEFLSSDICQIGKRQMMFIFSG